MKVNHSVKLELSREELEAVQIVYNMLCDIKLVDEIAFVNDISNNTPIEDVRQVLFDIWELSGHDINQL